MVLSLGIQYHVFWLTRGRYTWSTHLNPLEILYAASTRTIIIAIDQKLRQWRVVVVCQAECESGQLNDPLIGDDPALGKHVVLKELRDVGEDVPAAEAERDEYGDKPDE